MPYEIQNNFVGNIKLELEVLTILEFRRGVIILLRHIFHFVNGYVDSV